MSVTDHLHLIEPSLDIENLLSQTLYENNMASKRAWALSRPLAAGSAAAFLGFSFSHPEIHHSLFLFGLATVYTLLLVEARRYRFFDAYEYSPRSLSLEFDPTRRKLFTFRFS